MQDSLAPQWHSLPALNRYQLARICALHTVVLMTAFTADMMLAVFSVA